IPLAARACIGNLNLYAAGANFSSNGADLSAFGCDLTQWTTLRVISSHRHVDFFVNGKCAYSLSFPHDPTDIVGVQYRFSGTCAVKYARFTRGSTTADTPAKGGTAIRSTPTGSAPASDSPKAVPRTINLN
ncbi:MAG TPA: hypothetical protein VKU83_08640, partial [Puia sp.]|nr:hypothetical protein [Puia sp.]